MAKQIENSLTAYGRRDSSALPTIVGFGVIACLFIGLAAAFLAQNWLLAGIFLLSIGGLGAFAYVNRSNTRRLNASNDVGRIECHTALPEIQRQSLNLEVLELSRLLEVESGQISDLQSAYIVAEDLALRQIQQEEDILLMRHVTVGKAPFNAVFTKNGVVVCVDVSFLVAPDVRQEKIDALMRKVALVKRAFAAMKIRMKVRLMMVLVTQLTPEDERHLRSVLNSRRFSSTPVDIDIRLLDFEAMQKIYVTD